jgi:membrane-associated phospholipid phosphatase
VSSYEAHGDRGAEKYHQAAMPDPEPSPRPGPEPATSRASTTDAGAPGSRREIQALDVAVYAAISASPTPTLDRGFAALSRAADQAKIWIGVAGLLSTTGVRGRRSAVGGLASIAVTSGIVNLVLKPLRRRRRPDRAAHDVPIARHVDMPRSTSFPSGHAASAFAFASGVAHELPAAGVPLQAAAALVAYSRVHTGVHYPIDVIAGAVLGGALAPLTTAALERRRSS